MKEFSLILLISFISCIYGRSLSELSRGQPNNASLIVGGRLVNIRDYNYTVKLEIVFLKTYNLCTGAALNNLIILTAGHCLHGNPHTIRITIGVSHDYDIIPRGAVNQYYTNLYKMHPEFDYVRRRYDFGLIATRIDPWGLFFGSVRLPPSNRPRLGAHHSVTALGWGSATGNRTHKSDHLRAVTVPVVEHYLCFRIYWPSLYIPPEAFCSGDLGHDYRNTCVGDSGGPVVDSEGILDGIVSQSPVTCWSKELPFISTDVARVRKWIALITGV